MNMRDLSPIRENPLDSIEKKLDQIYQRKSPVFMQLQSIYHQVIRFRAEDDGQLLRIYKKITFLHIWPLQEDIWNSF